MLFDKGEKSGKKKKEKSGKKKSKSKKPLKF